MRPGLAHIKHYLLAIYEMEIKEIVEAIVIKVLTK